MGRLGQNGRGHGSRRGRRRDIAYRPLPSQRRFHESTARFKGFSGPIGSGKSQALCQEAIKLSYFPNNGLPAGEGLVDYGGMPFYDDWTQAQFLAAYGSAMATITTNTVNPASYPNEVTFLPELIGNFTNAIIAYVQSSEPSCRFEVLYPVDTNQTAFNAAINFPGSAWTPSILNVLKTEGFGYTLGRDFDGCETAIADSQGFPAAQRAHLVGIGDPTTPWLKEAESAVGQGFESVVLFALDQFCLIGYELPLGKGLRRSLRMG